MVLKVVKTIPAFVSVANMKEYGPFEVGETIKEGDIPEREFEMVRKQEFVAEEAQYFLDKAWEFLNCDKPKPELVLQRQHPTARYCRLPHKIELRDDSWRKMPEAEKKLVVLHEAIHACGVPHQPGFRTSIDTLSNSLYEKVWGKDKDWQEFQGLLEQKLKKIRRGEEDFKGCIEDSHE